MDRRSLLLTTGAAGIASLTALPHAFASSRELSPPFAAWKRLMTPAIARFERAETAYRAAKRKHGRDAAAYHAERSAYLRTSIDTGRLLYAVFTAEAQTRADCDLQREAIAAYRTMANWHGNFDILIAAMERRRATL